MQSQEIREATTTCMKLASLHRLKPVEAREELLRNYVPDLAKAYPVLFHMCVESTTEQTATQTTKILDVMLNQLAGIEHKEGIIDQKRASESIGKMLHDKYVMPVIKHSKK